jgi:hypothetical protein
LVPEQKWKNVPSLNTLHLCNYWENTKNMSSYQFKNFHSGRTVKIYQNLNFWYGNIPPGNPGRIRHSSIKQQSCEP